MAVSPLHLERRIIVLERKVPVHFAWSVGQTQPPVGTHSLVFWEDTRNDTAKILMRRGLRVYIFESHVDSEAPSAVVYAAPVRHVVRVVNEFNVPIAGATISTNLRYDNGTLHSPAPETVTVTDLGGGNYRVSFTPTVRGAMYLLKVESAGNVVSTPEFQDIAWAV